MAAEGSGSGAAAEAAPLLEDGVAAGRAGGGDPDGGADLEVAGGADREVGAENGRERRDPDVAVESNGCDLEVSVAADGEGGARDVAGDVLVSAPAEEGIDGESRIDAVRGGELTADDEHVLSRDLGVAADREDGEGETRSGGVDAGGAAGESAGHAARTVELVSEQCDNGVLCEPEVCVKENGYVEGSEPVKIEGGGLGASDNGVEGAADLHVEPINKVVLSEPERHEGENMSEGVADVQINGREDVQVEGNLEPARSELQPDVEEAAFSVPVSSVDPHDECVSHAESKDGLTLHVEGMPVIAFGGGEVEAERSEPREIVYGDKKAQVNGTCPESFVVGSIDCEIRDIVSSPDTGVPVDVREEEAPLGSLVVEANGHSLDEVHDPEVGEENKDGALETRENGEVCVIDDVEQQLEQGSASVELEELNANAESLEPGLREDGDEGDKVESSLSSQGEARSEGSVDVASSFDSNSEQKLEGSNNVDAHIQERDAASSDGCPTEQDREINISTLVTPIEDDRVSDTITLEIPIENEALAHDTTAIEICEVSSPVNVDGDVHRESKVDEENLPASVTHDKLSSEDDDEKQACKGDDGDAGVHENGVIAPSTIEDTAGLGIGSRFFMIRIPRHQDEKLAAQLQRSEACLEDRTHKRDLIGIKIREKLDSCDEYKKNINEARNEERAAREAFFSKQQEVYAINYTAGKIEISNSIVNVDDRIHRLNHTMQHETISLKEEKQFMKEIKELKQKRDHLSKMTPQSEMQKAFEQKDQIEENLKRLKPELEHLRKELSQAETKTKTARKKFDDESKIVEDLRGQRKAADDLRQEAYIEMKDLKKQLYEKNKLFYNYKNDVRSAVTFASSGNKEALQKHCNDQVERFMEMWNNNDEFRKQYVLDNQNSTIRRFRTLDARSLGLDEQPVLLPNATERRAESRTEAPSISDGMRPAVGKQDKSGKPLDLLTVSETSSHLANGKTVDRPKSMSKADPQTTSTLVSGEDAEAEDEERERKRAEDAELKRLADESARNEELRKEQAAAELKEKIRLEQIAKAREAEERKRRKVERAKAAAEIRARKEAEQREKKRAKKEKQKENKAASTSDAAAGTGTLADPVPDSIPEDTEEPESSTTVAMSRKQQRAPQVGKQQYKKTVPLPAPLLNRRRRRMPTWGWVTLSIALAFIVYLVGDYVPAPAVWLLRVPPQE